MCKLCDRDAELGEGWPVCQDDRLAVLEKDHQAMERLRKDGDALTIVMHDCGIEGECINGKKDNSDLADAILAVEEK